MRTLAIAAFALLCLGSAQGYGSGAPKDACENMIPQHHVDPQPAKTFPYAVTSNPLKKVVRAGDKVTIKIVSSDKSVPTFQGFLVQARVGNVPIGKFSPSKDVKVTDCGDGKGNAATHVNAKDKPEVTLQWTAPPNLSETVVFYATVAKNGGEFWVAQPTVTIAVKK